MICLVTYVTIDTTTGGTTMNQEQIMLLSKMKKLIIKNKRRFAIRNDGTDYISDLAELGLTEDEAWNEILKLNNYFFDDCSFLSKSAAR